MTWEYEGGKQADQPGPRQRPVEGMPDGIQDEVRPRPASEVIHHDGGELPVIGTPATGTGSGQVQRQAGGQVQPRRASESFSAIFGDIKRVGWWAVPSRSRVFSLFGDVYLDLREAAIQPGENRIDFFGVFGDLRIVVPEGMRAELRGSTVFGDNKVELGTVPPRPGPYVSLHCSGVFGDIKVIALQPGVKPGKRWRWF